MQLAKEANNETVNPSIQLKRPEHALPCLIFFLAHQYDWRIKDDVVPSLQLPIGQLSFFIEKLLTLSDNVAFLMDITEAIKKTRDVLDPSYMVPISFSSSLFSSHLLFAVFTLLIDQT